MKDKEKIYDEKISPLVKQILEICKTESLPMFCEFQFSNDGFSRSCIPSLEHNIWKIYQAMSRCKQGQTINIDKFLMWSIKEFDNSGSVYLYKYEEEKRKACANLKSHNNGLTVPGSTEPCTQTAENKNIESAAS